MENEKNTQENEAITVPTATVEEPAKAADAKPVGVIKAEAFQAFAKDNLVHGLTMEALNNDVNTHIFRSVFSFSGHKIPFALIMDDNVFTIIKVMLEEHVDDSKPNLYKEINDANVYDTMFYTIDENKNLVANCAIPSTVDHFDPSLVVAILVQMEKIIKKRYDAK